MKRELTHNNRWCYSLLLFGALLFSCFSTAQNKLTLPPDGSTFNSTLQKVLKTHPKSFVVLDSLLQPFKNDSTLMRTLALKSQDAHYLEGESYGLYAQGIISRNVSLYDEAIALHLKAKQLAIEAKNVELEIINLNMLGVVYRRMDLVKPALDYHKQALDIANGFINPNKQIKHSIAVSQNSMGNIYLALKQYDLALGQFNKSLLQEQEFNNYLGMAINYQNIGYAKEAKGQLEAALKDYKTSLKYNNLLNSEIGRVICYNSIGQIYIKQKKYSDATPILEQALETALHMGDQFYIATSYNNLGWLQNETNQDQAAELNLKRALQTGESYGLKSAIVDAYKHLSELFAKKGAYKTAMEYYKKSIEKEATISNERNLQYVNDIIVQYENEIKNTQIRTLANENDLVRSKLERNQRIFWFTIIGLVFIVTGLILLNRHKQLNQEKQILTLEQDMLRSQMNPHFIFNSLNSIKLYIINNEKENAVYYLNKFSKLIRKILVASTEKEISLADELETMKLYVNIENIRFSNQIDFKIHVDKQINTSAIRVPSLILQPFLENALWHGLSTKKNDKTITLDVYTTDAAYVTIAITDNGVGREASEKINKNKLLKRKSVGISLTKARLANFSKGFTTSHKLTIEDLYDKQGNPLGTKVIIDIPAQTQVLKTA